MFQLIQNNYFQDSLLTTQANIIMNTKFISTVFKELEQ